MTQPTIFTFFIRGYNKDASDDFTPQFLITINACGNEIVNLDGDVKVSIALDMDDPEPSSTVIDLLLEFSSNRTHCPVTSYVIKLTSEVNDPISDESLIYSLAGSNLELTPAIKGINTFFVFAIAGSGEYNVQEYNVTVYPCRSSIASVVSADAFTDIVYF